MSRLGDYLREERLRQGIRLGQLARMFGYSNVNKGSRRIADLERTGKASGELLGKVIQALGLEKITVAHLAWEDSQERRQEWETWVNEPVPMYLIVRLMAAFYSRVALPTEVTTPEQAEAWACNYARGNHKEVCLVVSRRLSVWINPEGEVEARTEAKPDEPNVPFMEVKGRRFWLEGQ